MPERAPFGRGWVGGWLAVRKTRHTDRPQLHPILWPMRLAVKKTVVAGGGSGDVGTENTQKIALGRRDARARAVSARVGGSAVCGP